MAEPTLEETFKFLERVLVPSFVLDLNVVKGSKQRKAWMREAALKLWSPDKVDMLLLIFSTVTSLEKAETEKNQARLKLVKLVEKNTAEAKRKRAEAEAELIKVELKLSRQGKPSSDLQQFWSCLVDGKVVERTERFTGLAESPSQTDIKTLTLQGDVDETCGCAKWGPSFAFSRLVERAEYVRCWVDICKKPSLKFVQLRGTKGIGKSVFIYWLMYKLVSEARSNGTAVPSILLITKKTRACQDYELLTVRGGKPVVQSVTCGTRADYTLSDIAYDTGVNTTYWNLHVVSNDTVCDPDVFRTMVEDSGKNGLKMSMSPCSLGEIQAMLGPDQLSVANFSYIVFGGSALAANLLNKQNAVANDAFYEMVQTELRQYLSGSVHEDENLILQAAAYISERIALTQMHSTSRAAIVKHSLFEHTYVKVINGLRCEHNVPASSFMQLLATVLLEAKPRKRYKTDE